MPVQYSRNPTREQQAARRAALERYTLHFIAKGKNRMNAEDAARAKLRRKGR